VPDTNYCTHIRVPSDTTLVVTSPIVLQLQHQNLHFEILGDIRYEGPRSASARLFRIWDTNNITIDGGGTIYSTFDPALHDDIPTTEPDGIATVFAVTGALSTNITIRDLTVTWMGSVLVVDTGAEVHTLTVSDIHADGLVHYGFFVNDRMTGSFSNCSVTNLQLQHGFRLYATGANLDVLSCWSHHENHDKTGIWVLEGSDITVDRFATNQEIIFGPDWGYCLPPPHLPQIPEPCANGSLTDVFARELFSTEETHVAMGVDGACLVNLCTPILRIGRIASQVAHDMPLDRTNWDSVFWPSPAAQVIIAENDNIVCGPPHPECRVHAINYNYCFADIDRNDAVDSDDLTAIILAWGACPSPPAGYSAPRPPCPADIHPNICGNNAVDTDDLIEVILRWGVCLDHPECGARPAKAAGLFFGHAPTSAQDCYEQCIAKYPNDPYKFNECFNACLDALQMLQ
jgi:hypothetical protein